MKDIAISWSLVLLSAVCDSYAAYVVKHKFNQQGRIDFTSVDSFLRYFIEFIQSPLLMTAVFTFLVAPVLWFLALNRLDLGIHYYSHAKATQDAAERAHLISEARLALERSSELDESLPEPYAVYGETFLLEGQEPGPGLRSLERAHRLVPYDPSLELSLARMYFALERTALARKMTLEVHAKTHSKSTRVEAEQLLQAFDAAAEAS